MTLPFVHDPATAELLARSPLLSADKPTFTVGWSVYVGWNPYYYMAKSGILRKWADKYGINIRVQNLKVFELEIRNLECGGSLPLSNDA